MSESLRGRVAKIISPSKIAINLGLKDGVEVGMKFIIYEEGEMICDPETRESLEPLELVKGKVEIINVQEKISIGESFEIISTTIDAIYSMREKYTTRIKTILTDEEIVEPKPGPIMIGDLVRSV